MKHKPATAWESELYGPGWSPTPDLSFERDKILQDFSYAGYRKGEAPIPDMADAKKFDAVAGFGADPTGARDSTQNIQAAIDAAGNAGGGLVLLPEGTYKISAAPENNHALLINKPGVVLRGAGIAKTFIVNTASDMRSKSVILLQGPESAGLAVPSDPVVRITRDLMTPTRHIPVENASGFKPGDRIVVAATVTDDWVREHNEPRWLGQENNRFMRLGSFVYLRDVLSVDTQNNTLEIDIPIRYFLRTRDNSRVYPKPDMLQDVGVEHFSIGNVQHPDDAPDSWVRNSWNNPNQIGGYQSHNSWLIDFQRVNDGWVRHVDSFQPDGNISTAHMLSSGIRLNDSARITIAKCHFQRPQYGGAGGNGYMFRFSNASDCLVIDCTAEFTRHGFVFSQVGSSGNVLLRCLDRDTGKATGATGNVNTPVIPTCPFGRYSDHHMKFSHSNLLDSCVAESSAYVAFYRDGNNHMITASHSVFWNTRGEVSLSAKSNQVVEVPFVVWSQQARYGYIIGTQGGISAVRTDPRDVSGRQFNDRTDPVDHVEGIGKGQTLDPQSLYLHQLQRRLGDQAPPRY